MKSKIDVNDIIGKTFNEITVLSYSHRDDSRGYPRHFYNCKCSCGKEFKCIRNQIISNKTKSCGHLNHVIKDISGNKYGRLKVISFSHTKNGRSFYNCICDCGKECIIARDALVDGRTKSCGCYSSEVHSNLRKSHGMSKTRIFRIWQHILGRCLNPNNDAYSRYGGRGIFVCDEWEKSFENFYNDMGEEYYRMAEIYGESNISINRIDNNDGYYKANCEWATQKTQLNNRSNNVYVTINGIRYTLLEAYNNFAIPGLNYAAVRDRYVRLQWDIITALTTPIDPDHVTHEYTETNANKYTRDMRAFYFDFNLIKDKNE